MSASKKLRGNAEGKPASELTRFKIMWRDSMSESAKDFWRSLWLSASTQAEVRKQISAKLKIFLTYDDQIKAMRDWDFQEQERDLEAARQLADEQQFLEESGGTLTAEELRERVIAASYKRSLSTGDFGLGLKTISADAKFATIILDKEKFEFDATKAALAKLDSLKAIRSNSKLSEDEKLDQARLELFGSAPK